MSNICPDSVIVGAVNMERRFRIGELSRRSGVSPDLLRAWERRYGLLRPSRTAGGTRLYTEQDAARVQAMQRQLAAGLATAEAAAIAAEAPSDLQPVFDTSRARQKLATALAEYDEERAHAAFDELVATLSLDSLLKDAVLPYLHDLGERWERGEISVAQEHFATALLRGRLLGLGRGWGQGLGPTALLACPPGEQHDLGLIAFGLALRARGWRILYLGPDTPLDSLAETARVATPDLIVVSAVKARSLTNLRERLADLTQTSRVAVGGPAANDVKLGESVLRLTGNPVEAADELTQAP
jgi:DNA-binding transcriptional MerR regulator